MSQNATKPKTSLDEIPALLGRYQSLDARAAELNALIDQAGRVAKPRLAAERAENRAEVESIRTKLEESGWPPTAPTEGYLAAGAG